MNIRSWVACGLALALAAVLAVGCGDAAKGSKTKAATTPRPNAAAVAWVEAFRDRDPVRLTELSKGRLRETYATIARLAELQHQVAEFLRGRYPDEADDRRLASIEFGWRRAISTFLDVEFLGLVESTAARSTYLFRVVNERSFPRDIDLVVESDEEGDHVVDIGVLMPSPEFIDALRGQEEFVKGTYEASMKAVEVASPRDLEAAIDVFAKSSSSQAAARPNDGR